MIWKVVQYLFKSMLILFINTTLKKTKDMLEDVGEISDILGRSYGMPDGIDEGDLDAELACLEDELESAVVRELHKQRLGMMWLALK